MATSLERDVEQEGRLGAWDIQRPINGSRIENSRRSTSRQLCSLRIAQRRGRREHKHSSQVSIKICSECRVLGLAGALSADVMTQSPSLYI
eukprot:3604288-Prymnesium_polylepis.1